MRCKKLSVVVRTALAMLPVALLVTNVWAAPQETVLHSFNYHDGGKGGSDPLAGLTSDAAGNLYGTTWVGGRYDAGTVFELSPKTGGGWIEKVLHNFSHTGGDGINPNASLI